MTDDQIRDVLGRLRAGDSLAQGEIFSYLANRFRPLARKMLRIDFPRVGLHAETDDILHDALCRLIPYLQQPQTTPSSSLVQFHGLVATVLRHTLLDAARKFYGTLQSHAIGDGLAASHPLLQESSGLKGWRERLEVHELVERLPATERQVLELSLYLGYGTGKIAECLQVHPGTVSKRLASAKEKLGRLLRSKD